MFVAAVPNVSFTLGKWFCKLAIVSAATTDMVEQVSLKCAVESYGSSILFFR